MPPRPPWACATPGTDRGRSTTCPTSPRWGGSRVGELAATIVANVFLLAALIWLQTGVADRHRRPVVPAPRPRALVVLAAVVHRRGGRSRSCSRSPSTCAAAGRTRTRSATRSSVRRSPSRRIYLLANHLLFNPAFVDAARRRERTDWLQVDDRRSSASSSSAIVGWDAIDGFLKARRSAEAARGDTSDASTLGRPEPSVVIDHDA